MLYVTIQLVAQGLLGDALANDPTPLASAAAVALGPAGRTMILVGSSVSMFAYVSGMTLAVPRMLFAFGRDGFLPAALARVHPTLAHAVRRDRRAGGRSSPRWRCSREFEMLAVAANVTGLARLRRVLPRRGGAAPARRAGRRHPVQVPGGAVVPWLALAVIAWLLWGLRREEWIAAAIVVLVAMGVYAVTAARSSRGAWREAA